MRMGIITITIRIIIIRNQRIVLILVIILLCNGILLIIYNNIIKRKKHKICLKVYLENKLVVFNQQFMVIVLLILLKNISCYDFFICFNNQISNEINRIFFDITIKYIYLLKCTNYLSWHFW